jgi:hypothetical protein
VVRIDVNTTKGLRVDTHAISLGQSAKARKTESSDFFDLIESMTLSQANNNLLATASSDPISHGRNSRTGTSESVGGKAEMSELTEDEDEKLFSKAVVDLSMIPELGILGAASQTFSQLPVDGEMLPDKITTEIGLTAITESSAYLPAHSIRDTEYLSLGPVRDFDIDDQVETFKNTVLDGSTDTDAVLSTQRQPSDIWGVQSSSILRENSIPETEFVSLDQFGYFTTADNKTPVINQQSIMDNSGVNQLGRGEKVAALPSELAALVIETKQPFEADTLYTLEQSRLNFYRGQLGLSGKLSASEAQDSENQVVAVTPDNDDTFKMMVSEQGAAVTPVTKEIDLHIREQTGVANADETMTYDTSALYDQVTVGIASGIKSNGDNQFTVLLKPEGLGEITVKMVEKEGRIQLKLIASSTETERLLSAEIGSLRESLKQFDAEILQVTSTEESQDNTFMSGQPDQFFTSDQQLQWSFRDSHSSNRNSAVLSNEVSKIVTESNSNSSVNLKDISGHLNIYI